LIILSPYFNGVIPKSLAAVSELKFKIFSSRKVIRCELKGHVLGAIFKGNMEILLCGIVGYLRIFRMIN
jgi:hypothetical protein